MPRCPFKRCPFHKTCSTVPFLCILVQYLAILGVLGWVAYLFFRG